MSTRKVDKEAGEAIKILADLSDAADAAVRELMDARNRYLDQLKQLEHGAEIAAQAIDDKIKDINEQLGQFGVNVDTPAVTADDESTDGKPDPAPADPVSTPTTPATPVVDEDSVQRLKDEIKILMDEIDRLESEVSSRKLTIGSLRDETTEQRQTITDLHNRAERDEAEIQRLQDEKITLQRELEAASRTSTKPCWGWLAWLLAFVGLAIGGWAVLNWSGSIFPDRHGVVMGLVRNIALLAIPTASFLTGGAIGSYIEGRRR